MSDLLFESLPSELRGEEALVMLPQRGPAPAEVLIRGEGLRSIDGWGAAAVRTKIEYHARYQARRVTLSPPTNAEAWRLLHALIRVDHPEHLIVPNDAESVDPSAPRSVILPAVAFRSLDAVDAISERLLDEARGRIRQQLRFVATALPEFVLNSLTHASASPTRPVACVFHDRSEDELQLVVCDLGERIARQAHAAAALQAALAARSEGAITTLAEAARMRGLDVTISLASGSGRLYWRAGRWHPATAQAVAGFTAAITAPLSS
jgi:hypothetical protein